MSGETFVRTQARPIQGWIAHQLIDRGRDTGPKDGAFMSADGVSVQRTCSQLIQNQHHHLGWVLNSSQFVFFPEGMDMLFCFASPNLAPQDSSRTVFKDPSEQIGQSGKMGGFQGER